jgi:AraC-like DNA-binding protein
VPVDQIPVSRGVLLRRLGLLGLDATRVLKHAGLAQLAFVQGKLRLTTRQFFALWQSIETLSGDPAFGLRIGSEAPPDQYDVASLAALHSASFGEALRKVARYKRLVCPEEVSIDIRDGEAALEFRWTLADSVAPTALIDGAFAGTLQLARRGIGEPVLPRRVELMRRPAHEVMLSRHFGCPVRFGCAMDRLVFDEALLARAFITHNEDLLALMLPALDAALSEQTAADSLAQQVSALINRGMRGQRPSVEAIAKELAMSPRTLQRRLTEAGTSYQQLLDETRHSAARHLLSDTDLDAGEIAFFLGFEELNSFARAFHQWEGTTPLRWRSELQPVADA